MIYPSRGTKAKAPAVLGGRPLGLEPIQEREVAPGRTLISEFGLSMHAESKRGNEARNLLMDFGFTHEALNNNNSLLAVNPSELDALVLSHGHCCTFETGSGWARHVRFGSSADMTARSRHVRFTPNSRHSSVQAGCSKSARSGYDA